MKKNKILSEWLQSDFFVELLELIPSHVFWKNKDGIYLGCNSAFARSIGLQTSEDVVGKNDYSLPVKKEYSDMYREEDNQIIKSGKAKVNIEEKQVLKDGKEIFLLTSKSPVFNENQEVLGILGIYSDITELKYTQIDLLKSRKKAETASKAKSEFIANMSHDIRTPITGIVGMIQHLLHIVKETEDSLFVNNDYENLLKHTKNLMHHVKYDSDILMASILQLLQLCNEILELTHLENGILDRSAESFDIYKLIQDNIEFLQPVAKNKHLKLTLEIDSQAPQYITGLRNYLDRTLLNLVSNALKFTEKGYVKVEITLLKDQLKSLDVDEKIVLQILVKDTGIGIPEDKFETIFEHFSRLTPSYQGIYKGSGLGLYTVKRYMEAMKGEIKMTSKVGEGTCFRIILPFIISDPIINDKQEVSDFKKYDIFQQKKNNQNKIVLDDSKNIKSERNTILIVEDSQLAAVALRFALRPFNLVIDLAVNGAEAIEKAKKNSYDLIFMDVGLPDISGIEITKIIRKFDDIRKSSVPIVAVTGHASDPQIKKECLNAGMQEVLSKPALEPVLKPILDQFIFKNIGC